MNPGAAGSEPAAMIAFIEAHDSCALRRLDPQSVGRGELALADQCLHLALLGEARQAGRQALDHPVLPAANCYRVKGRRAEAHPMRAHRLGVVDDLGDMQKRLGWDAADVETHAAKGRARVDQNHILPEIGGAEGGGVAAGTGAQNQDIGLEIGLAPRVGARLRRRPSGRGGFRSGLLDFEAAVGCADARAALARRSPASRPG